MKEFKNFTIQNLKKLNPALVIIPTYNEKENVELIIKAVFSLARPFDILIVDDNSPDGTGNIVKQMMKDLKETKAEGRLHILEREGKMGLGTAYIAGFQYALQEGYEFIFEMDADFSHNPSDLLELYDACENQNYDVAVGSRYISGVNVVNWPLSRVIMSYGASIYVRMITGMRMKDSTAGFVCYRRRVLEQIELERIKFIGYAFQIEMKFLAFKSGFTVKEVPIIFTDRKRGQSKMSIGIFKEAFFGVIKLKIASIFGKLPIKK